MPELTASQSEWTKQFCGIDPTVPASGPVGELASNDPLQGFEGAQALVPEALEKGVVPEVIGGIIGSPLAGTLRKAAAEAATGMAGATIAGVLVGAAILLDSTETADARHDETNPETGNPYRSDDEYREVQRRRREKPWQARSTRKRACRIRAKTITGMSNAAVPNLIPRGRVRKLRMSPIAMATRNTPKMCFECPSLVRMILMEVITAARSSKP